MGKYAPLFEGSMTGRRAFLVAGAAVTLSVGAPDAFADRCRIRGNPSVGACKAGCDSLEATFGCQDPVLFPSPEKVARGVAIGAVLGGAIAFAAGDVSILAGVVVGGIVGGVGVGVRNYQQFTISRALQNTSKAFEIMELEMGDDEHRLRTFVALDYANQLIAQIEPVALDLTASASRGVSRSSLAASPEWRAVRRAEPQLARLRAASTASTQTPAVYQQAMRSVGQLIGRRSVPAPSRDVMDRNANLAERMLRAVGLYQDTASAVGSAG